MPELFNNCKKPTLVMKWSGMLKFPTMLNLLVESSVPIDLSTPNH
ncbi:MAG: hypothetical protein ACI9CU_002643, partial [Polaribacter sp.]